MDLTTVSSLPNFLLLKSPVLSLLPVCTIRRHAVKPVCKDKHCSSSGASPACTVLGHRWHWTGDLLPSNLPKPPNGGKVSEGVGGVREGTGRALVHWILSFMAPHRTCCVSRGTSTAASALWIHFGTSAGSVHHFSACTTFFAETLPTRPSGLDKCNSF